MNRFVLATGKQQLAASAPFAGLLVKIVWATGLGHGRDVASYRTTKKCLFAGTSRDGSDGTRTRDLRRDRPSRAQPRAATNSSEPPRLQMLLARSARPLRMVDVMTRR